MKPPTKTRTRASRPARSSKLQNFLSHAALDRIPIGMVLLDSRLRILSVNAEAVRLVGHSAEFCASVC